MELSSTVLFLSIYQKSNVDMSLVLVLKLQFSKKVAEKCATLFVVSCSNSKTRETIAGPRQNHLSENEIIGKYLIENFVKHDC